MTRRILEPPLRSRRALLALPWPEEAVVLTADDLCPYVEPRPGSRSLWDWLRVWFDRDDPGQRSCHDQFCHVLQGVLEEHCDVRDRGLINFSRVPSPESRTTAAPYGAAEVAAWWNEALTRVGYSLVE